ncbi:MAG: YtxH domain-containing protein [Candidatus Beckwithbacteria bacterium]|nr:YtxH domain-containing protein [Candidatus Beckwithbacteria bacterium]
MSPNETKNKSLPFASGLLVGAAVAAGATFLYKTKSGQKVKKVLSGYYREAKEHLDEVIKEVKKDTKTKTLPQAVEKIAQKEVKAAKKKIKAIKKKVFSKSGRPLVK